MNFEWRAGLHGGKAAAVRPGDKHLRPAPRQDRRADVGPAVLTLR
jgi:hypothetical protein